MQTSPTVLLIDDEPEILSATKSALEVRGYKVYTAESAEIASRYLLAVHPQLLLVDYKLPGMSGTQFMRQVRATNPTLPAIMITGLASEFEGIEASCRCYGMSAFLRKPLQIEVLLKIIHEAMKQPLVG